MTILKHEILSLALRTDSSKDNFTAKQENDIYQLSGTLPGLCKTLALRHWGHPEDYSGDSTNAYRVAYNFLHFFHFHC